MSRCVILLFLSCSLLKSRHWICQHSSAALCKALNRKRQVLRRFFVFERNHRNFLRNVVSKEFGTKQKLKLVMSCQFREPGLKSETCFSLLQTLASLSHRQTLSSRALESSVLFSVRGSQCYQKDFNLLVLVMQNL